MIEDLDEAIRKLLIREIPIKNGEIDIQFDLPKREWSARLSRPTLNIFLHDIRENQKLRQAQPLWETERHPDGTATQRRKPVRVDLHYLITAWTAEPEDEHRLLGRTMMALFRYADLPLDILPESLLTQPRAISIMVAQYDELQNPTDIWSVLDNEIHPAIVLTLTLTLDPYTPTTTPLVRLRELRMGPSSDPVRQMLDAGLQPDTFWSIGGNLRSQQPLEAGSLRLTLVEQDRQVPVQPDGHFVIGHLRAGNYTLEVTAAGHVPRRYPIAVPAADYDLEI